MSLKLFFITNRQKLSIVVICARCSNVDCLCKCSLSGVSRRRFSIASPILCRISPAAALVKVTINKRSISTGFFSSRINPKIRSTSTAVFPLPAAAETNIFLSLTSITFFCSGVNCTPHPSFLPYGHFSGIISHFQPYHESNSSFLPNP